MPDLLIAGLWLLSIGAVVGLGIRVERGLSAISAQIGHHYVELVDARRKELASRAKEGAGVCSRAGCTESATHASGYCSHGCEDRCEGYVMGEPSAQKDEVTTDG